MTKFKIIPEYVLKSATVPGYFEAFREIVYDHPKGETAFIALEEMRQSIGWQPRYSNYSSFKSAKSRYEKDKTFSGEVKYV